MPTLRRKIAERLLGERSHHAARAWRAARRRSPFEPRPQLRAARRFVAAHGLVVSRGPFTGLVFPPSTIGVAALAPKLIGAFELELHEALEQQIAARPDLIVNVGSAEGYYAVGLAQRLSHATVVAFESDAEERRLLRLCARANAVEGRIDQRGHATPEALSEVQVGSTTLLVLDCEGAEDVLLDPQLLPQLRSASILVELHEHLVAGVAQRLITKFRDTHEVTRIWATDRTAFELGAPFSTWSECERTALLDEGRPASMSWLNMVPRFSS